MEGSDWRRNSMDNADGEPRTRIQEQSDNTEKPTNRLRTKTGRCKANLKKTGLSRTLIGAV